MCLQESVDVKLANKTFSVNVADMTAINTDTYKEHLVLRTEMTGV